MAKTPKEAPLTTRNARAGLSIGTHWRGIEHGTHLGYRKAKRGGRWLVRWYEGTGKYRQDTLGTADDVIGEGNLDFGAARKAAEARVAAARLEAKALADGAPLTVALAVERYAAERDGRDSKRAGRSVRSDASQRMARYIVGREVSGGRSAVLPAPIASALLHSLTERQLAEWRAALPASLKASTVTRLVNDFKAALNGAYEVNRDRLPPSLPDIIKHGLKAQRVADDDSDETVARDSQILRDAQVSALIGAAARVDAEQGWEGDLYRLVVLLAATGARMSQVARIRVADLQRSAGRVMVPVSRKGKGKAGFLAVQVGTDVLDALLPATTGRPGKAALLERWRSKQMKGSIRWVRDGRGPWQSPSELTRPWLEIRSVAGLPEVIPYAFRHSSIVRGIRANLPLRLVAAMHDTSTVMIERHYAKFIVDGLDELAARAVVPLVPQPLGQVSAPLTLAFQRRAAI